MFDMVELSNRALQISFTWTQFYSVAGSGRIGKRHIVTQNIFELLQCE